MPQYPIHNGLADSGYFQHLLPENGMVVRDSSGKVLGMQVVVPEAERPLDISSYQGVVEEVQVQSIQPVPRIERTPDWALGIFLLGFVAIIWIRIVFPRHFLSLFSVVLKPRLLRQTMREDVPITHASSLALLLLFALTGGMLLYQMQTYGFEGFRLFSNDGVILFLKLSGVVALVYLVKVIVVSILRFLLRDNGVIGEYLFSILTINKLLGIMLLPITIAIAYMHPGTIPVLIWIGLGTLVLFWLYRIIRGILTGIGARVSVFYLFLYLCTLEILPLIVVFGIFKGEISVFS